MDTFILPSMAYNASLPATTYNQSTSYDNRSQVRASQRHTFIQDSPQEYTPRRPTFDDLYDVSEPESDVEDISIGFALSPINTKTSNYSNHDIPSLSPTAWPTHNHKPGVPQPFNPALLSPVINVPKMKLDIIANRSSIHSSTSNAPSLDGSMTSEEMATASCPSTPDLSAVDDNFENWTLPAQLDPLSLATLDNITQPPIEEQTLLLPPIEMQETGRGHALFALKIDTSTLLTAMEDGELSAISVPSPGGFFASLDAETRSVWSGKEEIDPVPPTAFAANFYGVPFAKDSPPPIPDIVTTQLNARDGNYTDGPPTAYLLPGHWARTPGLEALKSANFTKELSEYQDNYENKLDSVSTANLDRTADWLSSQLHGSGSPSEADPEELAIPEFPKLEAPTFEQPVEPAGPRDPLFIDGFKHIQTNKKSSDAFIHRKARIEKLRLDRKCLVSSHIKQLEGQYSAKQPITAIRLPPENEDDKEKVAIEIAIIEQDVLEQLAPLAWNVDATKYLNGGTLLTSPTATTFNTRKSGRILDLGGFATCDWSWQVALDHPGVTVHTVCTADQPFDASIATPSNHKQSVVPNLWTLPFPNDHFDCISARNVYSLLKLDKPVNSRSDEYELCLRECMRLLRPGGFLEFNIMDADVMNAGYHANKLSIEFKFNLSNRGYDAAPTKTWLTRLRKAGFHQIHRAWMVLPMSHNSEGTTADASHLTGMVGSWAWERWMLKLYKEMGKDEQKLMDSVVGVLEEGAKTGGSWRCLSGWARKPSNSRRV